MPPRQMSIAGILKHVGNNLLTREELNYLIEKSYLVSISFLKTNFRNKLNFLKDEKHVFENIAMDAIVPLFIKNSKGRLGISQSLENWDHELESDADADYFLSRIIWKRVDQTVTKILKERDPIFEKILKTLNICIDNKEFIKKRYFGTVLVLKAESDSLCEMIIDHDSFNKIPESYFAFKQAELLNTIFNYIKNETDFFPAIPLNMLVARIKNYHINRFNFKFSEEYYADSFLALNDIVNNGLSVVKEKLEIFYVGKNKIDTKESEMIMSSFQNIAIDMLNGSINGSLFSYLKESNNSLQREEFYKIYHPMMNYLFKQFKKEVAEKISL